MARLTDAGLTDRAYFLIGLGPFASAKAARWMNENLHGVNVPDAVIRRIAGATDERAEGRRICVELIQWFREIPGVHGVHLMGPRQEPAIAEIVRDGRRPVLAQRPARVAGARGTGNGRRRIAAVPGGQRGRAHQRRLACPHCLSSR